MHLSKINRIALAKEIRTVADYMKKTDLSKEKIYFFSAIYGVAQRIMNLEYDPELGFIHYVTNNAYNTFNSTQLLISQGNSMPNFPSNLFDRLQEALEELAIYVEEEKQTYPILEKISNLALCTSGNGYYLFLKGMLKI